MYIIKLGLILFSFLNIIYSERSLDEHNASPISWTLIERTLSGEYISEQMFRRLALQHIYVVCDVFVRREVHVHIIMYISSNVKIMEILFLIQVKCDQWAIFFLILSRKVYDNEWEEQTKTNYDIAFFKNSISCCPEDDGINQKKIGNTHQIEYFYLHQNNISIDLQI